MADGGTDNSQQGLEAMQALMLPFLAPFAVHAAKSWNAEDVQHWQANAAQLQQMWAEFGMRKLSDPANITAAFDPSHWPSHWQKTMADWTARVPAFDEAASAKLWDDIGAMWQSVLGAYTPGQNAPDLPRSDKRFADERWRAHPAFALLHQTYLLVAERMEELTQAVDMPEEQRTKARFAAKAMADAASPANFPLTNPVVLERTMETRGDNLVKGMRNLLSDMQRGQLSHTDSSAFTVGENIATTPGKVVHETPLYQLIQYSPTTDEVLKTPLVIFPPWINRFYILDLNPKKSFVRWAVEQGVTVFMVSWKSADASMKDVVWDDYIAAQIDAMDHVRARLDVPSVHTIGYCVAGTTLAATLALLHRRGEADKVATATFFTAQVDFAEAGELLNFIDDQQLAGIEAMSPDGYLDGRYMAAAFNMLRGTDLIWNYVVNNYLLGEDYPAFDLLHWNGDVTNLPAKWHNAYLRDLYRDNRLSTPDSMVVDGTPIDLSLIETPTYVQAGREDHIAPAKSVWKLTEHFSGPARFVLAGSGHIAGVVNPPDAGKYQYWVNEDEPRSLEEFQGGATEHKGSWWPDWIEWLEAQDARRVPAKNKRRPGGRGDTAIEDAPGRYVTTR